MFYFVLFISHSNVIFKVISVNALALFWLDVSCCYVTKVCGVYAMEASEHEAKVNMQDKQRFIKSQVFKC